MPNHNFDLSTAITTYLANYPGSNREVFHATFPDNVVEEAVREILLETNKIQIEWGEKNLSEIAAEVRQVMRERHPDLTEPALRDLGSYFTYLVR